MSKRVTDGTGRFILRISAICISMMVLLLILVKTCEAECPVVFSIQKATLANTADYNIDSNYGQSLYDSTEVWIDCYNVPVWLQRYVVEVTTNLINNRPDYSVRMFNDKEVVKLTPSLIMAVFELNTNFGKNTNKIDDFDKFYFSGITGQYESNYKHGLFGITDCEIEAYEYTYKTTVEDRDDTSLGVQLTVINWWINYYKLTLRYGKETVDQCIEKWESRLR